MPGAHPAESVQGFTPLSLSADALLALWHPFTSVIGASVLPVVSDSSAAIKPHAYE